MADLYAPPPVFELPVSRGGDIVVEFNNKVEDSNPVTYVDFPDGTTVTLTITSVVTPKLIESLGIIDGHTATCRIPADMADRIVAGALWRCVLGNDVGWKVVAMNGKVVRADGD